VAAHAICSALCSIANIGAADLDLSDGQSARRLFKPVDALA